MKWLLLAVLLGVLSCTPARSPTAPRLVDVPLDTPRELRACAPAPATPPLPRTIQQIGDYANALAAAHEDCTRVLRRLNRWLSDKKVTLNAGT